MTYFCIGFILIISAGVNALEEPHIIICLINFALLLKQTRDF